MTINLDPQAARAGSAPSSRIDSKGKYKGTIVHAKKYQLSTGSTWVEIYFKADTEQEAKLKLCIISKTGDFIPGYKKLQAIMACCKLRTLTETQATIKDYNRETKQLEDMQATVFQELAGQKIGFALYREDGTNRNTGNDFFNMEIAAPFTYENEQTAQEFLDQQPPKQLENIISGLRDVDKRQQNAAAPSSDFGFQQPAPADDPYNWDCPV